MLVVRALLRASLWESESVREGEREAEFVSESEIVVSCQSARQ